MDRDKLRGIEAAGWRTGDAADFLELSPEEAAFVELKLALADYLRGIRIQRGWTQTHVAQLLGSSQSRVAKMEAADASVSIDLLVRSLLRLGATRTEVAEAIARAALEVDSRTGTRQGQRLPGRVDRSRDSAGFHL